MKQKFTEIFSKRLKQAFLSVHADKEIHFLKKEGVITIGWERLAQVRPKADKTCTVWWIHEAAERHGVKKDKIQETFDGLCRSAGASSLPWSL